MSYLSDVCAEVGVGVIETRPGEDHYAIDAYVRLSKGMVSVQVKCTTRDFTKNTPRHLSWPIEDEWWDKWLEDSAPVFILLVRVPRDEDPWIEYDAADVTTHNAAAYWVAIDKSQPGAPKSVVLEHAQRFTAESLAEWDQIHRVGLGLA